MAIVISDFGDYYDKIEGHAWDFIETNIPVYWIDKYPYKARTLKNAYRLAILRSDINKLCDNLIKNQSEWENNVKNHEYKDGVNIFLGLHNEYYHVPETLPSPFFEISKKGIQTSRYLLSEIPKNNPFHGLNKPKMRYIDKRLPLVGKDKNGRALYRDIFLDLDRSEKSLKELIIHELSHSMANHIMFRPDDHHEDFKWCEKLITKFWPIG